MRLLFQSQFALDQYMVNATGWERGALYTGAAATMLLSVATIAMNVISLTVLSHRSMSKSISNCYLRSVAVADGLVGLLVMLPAALHIFQVPGFFVSQWMCDFWQLLDKTLSTISLLSIAAITFDRSCNLVTPLCIFKRSRRLARHIIMAIWILPGIIYVPVYFFFTRRGAESDIALPFCSSRYSNDYVLPVLGTIFYYVPTIALVVMFDCISHAVRNHTNFLRQHSNVGCGGGSGQPPYPISITNGGAQNSTGSHNKERNSTRTTPEPTKKISDASQTTITSGYSTLRSPRSQSPRYPKAEFQLAPLSEERSSGRERSFSEQIPHAYVAQFEENSNNHLRITGVTSIPARKESLQENRIVMVQRGESIISSIFKFRQRRNSNTSQDTEFGREETRPMGGSSYHRGSHASFMSRRFSSPTGGMGSTKRFSIIAIPGVADLFSARDGASKQARANKAVAQIFVGFLVCWAPFLVLWPVKFYAGHLVYDWIYVVAVWLSYACSCLNPFIYTLSNPRCRALFRSFFTPMPHASSMQKPPHSFYRSITVV